MNRERLLNVARALRESKKPEEFTMHFYAADCGTPACALGHYAARHDLQDCFALDQDGDLVEVGTDDGEGFQLLTSWDFADVLNHFGITLDEADKLFSSHGCSGATTPIEAAEYIEQFVERHEEEARQARTEDARDQYENNAYDRGGDR